MTSSPSAHPGGRELGQHGHNGWGLSDEDIVSEIVLQMTGSPDVLHSCLQTRLKYVPVTREVGGSNTPTHTTNG